MAKGGKKWSDVKKNVLKFKHIRKYVWFSPPKCHARVGNYVRKKNNNPLFFFRFQSKLKQNRNKLDFFTVNGLYIFTKVSAISILHYILLFLKVDDDGKFLQYYIPTYLLMLTMIRSWIYTYIMLESTNVWVITNWSFFFYFGGGSKPPPSFQKIIYTRGEKLVWIMHRQYK